MDDVTSCSRLISPEPPRLGGASGGHLEVAAGALVLLPRQSSAGEISAENDGKRPPSGNLR